MASDALFQELAKALARPSSGYRAATAALEIPGDAIQGYESGAKLADQIQARKLGRQTLSEALGGNLPPGMEGFGNTTVNAATALDKPITAIAALQKALQERNQKGRQLFGTQGKNALVFDPNGNGSVSTIPLPSGSDEPIIPKAAGQTLSPYADPSGTPLAFTPGRGFTPVPSGKGTTGKPVLKQGNEQAVSDAAMMQMQAPNIDKMFDAYKDKGPVMARLQATPAGSVLDPVAKQAENSLKLAAFTFGGKQLTGQEKDVVFGAFFPSVTDNAQSLENKRALLKDYFAGKVDLLQAANLLGPAGAPLKGMLQSKMGNPDMGSDPGFAGGTARTFGSEQEAEASGYKGPAIINGQRAVIH